MIIERKNALKMWEELYGKSVEATDFAGRKMNKSAYDQKNSKFGWTVTCLLPRSAGGKPEGANLMCVHTDTEREKGEGYPFFVTADKKYEITYVIDTESWVIEEAHDDASIAEAEAKAEAAKSIWEELFDTENNTVYDFSGREIHKDEYLTESEYAWKTVPYVDSKPMEGKNIYIAALATVEEALGKTAFKANGKNFTLNKENGAYYFKELEIKQPKEQKTQENVYDVKNPYDVAKKLKGVTAACENGDSMMLDFIVIRTVTNNASTAGNAQAVTDAVSTLLTDAGCTPMGCEVSEMADAQGARYMFITFRFPAAQPSDFERIFEGAQTLNNYAQLLMSMLGLIEFKVYNYAEFINRAHIRFSVGYLCGYYPQFGALMDCIYKSAEGFYRGEPAYTLYVANMIIVNIPKLAEMHPQETEQFYTPVYLAEHNYLDLKTLGVIQGVIAGLGEEPAAETEAEVADEADEEPIIAPATEEIDSDEENEKLEEAEEEAVWVSTEAENDEEGENAGVAPDNAADAPVEKVEEAVENEPIIAPVTKEATTQSTPQGEQLTMSFASDAEPTPEEDEDDGIITLDLDMLD